MGGLPGWRDGRLLAPGEPALPADDGAFLDGRGCYTTARLEAGQVRWAERHAERLRRDARSLGLGDVAPAAVRSAFAALGAAAFPDGRGVLRLQASRGGDGALHLTGVARPLGLEREAWRAVLAPFCHPGPMPWGGAKLSGHPLHALARDAAAGAGADEALLCDDAGRLVEGARTNLAAVDADGPFLVPLERGGVAGVAREVLCERLPDLPTRDLLAERVGALQELVALNAVRGARPIVRIGDRAVGDGRPGPWAGRLSRALA